MPTSVLCFVSLSVASLEEHVAARVRSWKQEAPATGLLALVPEAEAAQVPHLQHVCAALDVPLVGAIFPALVTHEGFANHGCWLLRFDEMPPYALLDGWSGDAMASAQQVVAFVDQELDESGALTDPPVLFLIMDAMLPNIASILEQLYGELADAVRYAGVNAGSETFTPMPCLFDHSRVVERGALCLLCRDRRMPVLEHGFVASDFTMTATSTERNRILSIDWRSAFEVYQELVKRDFGVSLTHDNFYQYAVHFPFGIVRACDDLVVRIPVSLNDDNSLYCVGEVPPNAMLTLLKGPSEGASLCVHRLTHAMSKVMGGAPIGALVTFYCAGRRMQMGEAAKNELVELSNALSPQVMAGALSLGELGSELGWGYPLFHNAALLCVVWDPV